MVERIVNSVARHTTRSPVLQVPNAGQALERLDYRTKEWDVAMLAYLKGLEAKKPVVWTGDLNVS